MNIEHEKSFKTKKTRLKSLTFKLQENPVFFLDFLKIN